MNGSPRHETVFTALRWVFVLYVLVAPRVVSHRHADISGLDGANRILVSHLQRYHHFDQFPIDDRKVHTHLSFFTLTPEIPFGSSTQSCWLLAPETGNLNLDGLNLTRVAMRLLPSEQIDEVDSPCFTFVDLLSARHCGTSSFRRIHFGVWTI